MSYLTQFSIFLADHLKVYGPTLRLGGCRHRHREDLLRRALSNLVRHRHVHAPLVRTRVAAGACRHFRAHGVGRLPRIAGPVVARPRRRSDVTAVVLAEFEGGGSAALVGANVVLAAFFAAPDVGGGAVFRWGW
mmetsp:Transcript_3378/g.7004  ORF Transcript_3378/g.7004 Transcript_3378/m.7004 type:complete len:134 (-) Transcript_3378:768-1169(-)